jgi:hypothetical protein
MPDNVVRRDAAETKKKLLFAGGTLIFAIALWIGGIPFWPWVVGVGAIAIFVSAIYDSGEALCPRCETLLGLGSGFNQCANCGHFFEIDGGRLREIERSSVTGLPFFGIPWTQVTPSMPPLCCACGVPASRTVRISMEAPIGSGPITTQVARFAIDMPHCENHNDGADIGSDSRRRAKDDPKHTFGNEFESFLAVRVKSYAFYCEFMRMNGNPHFWGTTAKGPGERNQAPAKAYERPEALDPKSGGIEEVKCPNPHCFETMKVRVGGGEVMCFKCKTVFTP